MVLKFEHFGKCINTWTVLKCGVGEGWRRIGMRKDEVLQMVKEERYILHAINRRKADWSGHILRRN